MMNDLLCICMCAPLICFNFDCVTRQSNLLRSFLFHLPAYHLRYHYLLRDHHTSSEQQYNRSEKLTLYAIEFI